MDAPTPPQHRLLHLKLSKTYIILGIILLLILILAAVFFGIYQRDGPETSPIINRYWEDADIALTSFTASPVTGVTLKVTNYLSSPITLSGVVLTALDGTEFEIADLGFPLLQGEEKEILDTQIRSLCASPGAAIAVRVRIDYEQADTKAAYSTFGKDNLLYGTCIP